MELLESTATRETVIARQRPPPARGPRAARLPGCARSSALTSVVPEGRPEQAAFGFRGRTSSSHVRLGALRTSFVHRRGKDSPLDVGARAQTKHPELACALLSACQAALGHPYCARSRSFALKTLSPRG